MAYVTVGSHRHMALDAVRNEAYAQALRAIIRPDSVVLDLGAGVGILGLMAARLGARRVYLVEPEDIIAIAEENIRANGLQDVVRCLHGRIEAVTVPEPVDVITSVMTGNFLLTEDLLPSLFYARDRYLRPGGALVPDRATMDVVPVSAPAIHDREVAIWSAPYDGLTLEAARSYAANSVLFRVSGLEEVRDLAAPVPLLTLDFARAEYAPIKADVKVPIVASGVCHGWVGSFTMKLADRWLSTSHRSPRTHWSPAFLPLDPPLAFEQGEEVAFHLARAPHSDWVWGTKARSGSQRHSTLLSTPMKSSTLAKAAIDHQPALTAEGSDAAYVLSQCDGIRTMTAIAAALRARAPERFRTDAEALGFVQAVVRQYA